MNNVTFRHGTTAWLLILASAVSLGAQENPSNVQEDIKRIEKRLEQIEQESAELRRMLDELRATVTTPGQEPKETVDDLLAIEPLEPAGQEPALEAADPLEARPVQSQVAVTGANIFNPSIAIVGNLVGAVGDEHPIEERSPIDLAEAELSLQAWIDPYAQANFFIGFSEEEGAAVEEAYAEFVRLPWDLVGKAGKMKATFGKFNQQHFHAWSWVDAPLVIDRFFGEEGLADSGISASRLIPNPWGLFLEGTAEVYRGEVEDVFERESRNDLLYLGHLKAYHDLSESSNIELGGSWARGSLPESEGQNEFTGVDLTYRWKPLQRAMYRSLLARAEIVRNERDDQEESATGWYASADYQFARRWTAGLRFDRTDLPEDPSLTERSQSLLVTFRPSEFSLFRTQLRRFDVPGFDPGVELLMQLQFAIGAHGAHKF